MKPKGQLLIIGGAGKKWNDAHELLHSGKRNARIEVISNAPENPVEALGKYITSLMNGNVGYMNICTKEAARKPAFVQRIREAHTIVFTGNPFWLSLILDDSPVLELIREKYMNDEHFTVAGLGAGAMSVARLIISGGDGKEALVKGDVLISPGMDLLGNCIIDTHFDGQGCFARLALAVVMAPDCTGIGLGENTALIVRKGNELECVGDGMVMLIDGRAITNTNIDAVEEGASVSVENLLVHMLTDEHRFLLDEREFVPVPTEVPV